MESVQEDVLATFLNEFRPRPQGLSPDTICERTGIDCKALPGIRQRLVRDGFVFEDDEDGRWKLEMADGSTDEPNHARTRRQGPRNPLAGKRLNVACGITEHKNAIRRHPRRSVPIHSRRCATTSVVP